MIRCNKLVLGMCFASVAAIGLVATPANAGNSHKGHGHNTVTHLSIGNGYGVNQRIGNGYGVQQNFKFHSYHSHNFHHQQFIPTHVTYAVLVKQPNRYGNWNWHQVNTFSSHSRAIQHASFLDSRFQGDHGFAVKVVQFNH